MASGLLFNDDVTAAEVLVYRGSSTGVETVLNLNVVNLSGSGTAIFRAGFGVSLSDSLATYFRYNHRVAPSGVLEVKGIALRYPQHILCEVSNTGSVIACGVTAWGLEEVITN